MQGPDAMAGGDGLIGSFRRNTSLIGIDCDKCMQFLIELRDPFQKRIHHSFYGHPAVGDFCGPSAQGVEFEQDISPENWQALA